MLSVKSRYARMVLTLTCLMMASGCVRAKPPLEGMAQAEITAAGFDIEHEVKSHNTSPALYRTGSGVIATHNISMNDLTVVLVMGSDRQSS